MTPVTDKKHTLSDLTIACSTYGNRLVGAQKVLASLRKSSPRPHFIVIHQVPDGEVLSAKNIRVQKELEKNENTTYLQFNEQGLTRSRNHAITHAKTKYIWFVDDDLSISEKAIFGLELALKNINFTVLTLRSEKESGGPRTKFPKHGDILSSRDILRVASVEIVADRDFLIDKTVRFREDMGVGSNGITNLGEESVFLCDIRKSGGSLRHAEVSGYSHPDISTGTIIDKINVYSKGVTIGRCFEGKEKLKFYIKDAYKILKNRKNQFGSIQSRAKLFYHLTRGCFHTH